MDAELDHPDPRVHRPARCERHRARHPAVASNDQQPASDTLVRVSCNHRDARVHPRAIDQQRGPVVEVRMLLESDVQGLDFAALRAGEQVAALDRPEREGQVGDHGAVGDGTSRGVDAARKVESDHQGAAGTRVSDRRRKCCDGVAQGTGRSGSEQRIDDHVRRFGGRA